MKQVFPCQLSWWTSGPETIARFRQRPAVTRQVRGEKAGPRSGQEGSALRLGVGERGPWLQLQGHAGGNTLPSIILRGAPKERRELPVRLLGRAFLQGSLCSSFLQLFLEKLQSQLQLLKSWLSKLALQTGR